MGTTVRMRVAIAILACTAIIAAGTAEGAATRIKSRIFRPVYTPTSDRVSTSDPANNPLSVASFLAGSDDSAMIDTWSSAIEPQPMGRTLEQEVLMKSQAQAEMERQQQQQQQGEDGSFLEGWIEEGHHASHYEPKSWPEQSITPDPYAHLAQTQGGVAPHNNIQGALGVQSAAIPWDYRHYSGNLNSHRKAEPLIYTPLVLAKNHDGTSAIDLTSLANHKYQSERMSSNPQYANTLSALTDYKPIQLHPTDHWLPQMPVNRAPGVKNTKYWEKHFLDLYAPTPPPLLAPVPPRMKQPFAPNRPIALVETAAAAVELPAILRQGERVKPLITTVLDRNQQPIAFHDDAGETDALMKSRDIDIFAPAQATAFLESEVDIENENENEMELDNENDMEMENEGENELESEEELQQEDAIEEF